MTQVIAHSPRDANLATLDQSLEPSGDVHAVAKDVALLDHDVADIDADPKAHPPAFRLAFVRPLKRRLDLDRGANCVENARELGEHAVAGGIRDPTSMPRDELVDKGPTGGQRGHRRFFVAMHQAAVALDIRDEDCRETSLERRGLHSKKPLPFHKPTFPDSGVDKGHRLAFGPPAQQASPMTDAWGSESRGLLSRGAGTRCLAFVKAYLSRRGLRLSTPSPFMSVRAAPAAGR